MVGVRSRTHIQDLSSKPPKKLMAIAVSYRNESSRPETNQVSRHSDPNAPHSNTRSVAELVIAEIVMLLRGIGDKSCCA